MTALYFVHRDGGGAVDGVALALQDGWTGEQLVESDPAIASFMSNVSRPAVLADSDVKMARVCEDLVLALLAAGVVTKAALPPTVITIINARRAFRGQPAV